MRGLGYWLLGSLVILLSTGACGDDEDEPDGGAGAPGSGGSGSGNVSCTPGPDGACTNASDCPKVESGEIRTAAQTCGLGCLGNADAGTCAVTCIVEKTGASAGCSACYAGLVKCATEKCLAECGAAPGSAECNQCQIDMNCRSGFDACSGLKTN